MYRCSMVVVLCKITGQQTFPEIDSATVNLAPRLNGSANPGARFGIVIFRRSMAR